MGVTAAIVTSIAAVGSTVNSISSQQKAAKASSLANAKAEADATQLQKDGETKAIAAGRDAQAMAKARAAAGDGPFGQSGTILTGPQGVTNPIVPGKKTLLGA